MSKAVDVDLRIRAKNLAGKTLTEINAQVEALTDNQKKQASSADLAARSTKDLVAEQNALAAATRELTRRRGLADSFAEQRKQIGETAAKLKELTATYRQMQAGSGGSLIGFSDRDLKQVGAEVIQTEKALRRLVAQNKKTGDSLAAAGIDAGKLSSEVAQLDASIAKASAGYDRATANVNEYTAATARSAAVQAEAARRQAESAAAVQRAQGTFGASSARAGELAALRADIEARSEQARAIEVTAAAEKRLAAEQATAAAAQDRATAAIRAAVQAYDAQQARRNSVIAAVEREAKATAAAAATGERRRNLLIATNKAEAESAARKERLAAVIERLTGATDRNAASTRRAAGGLTLFNDVGRKSLGTYQRLRGQVLGLAAAYVGVYQAINTFQKSIAATNRNDSLQIGLRTVNNGDAVKAAADYKFLREEADRLGLVFDDIAPQFANVAIAAKAMGLNGRQARDVFSDVATAAAAMNLSVEDTEGVFRAVTQIFSKGKVQAEELRGQLGDRLPGAVVLFAKASGIALSDLDKQLKDGTVGLDFLIKGIKQYAGQYDSEIENISNRLNGYINRATNSYNDFLRSLLTGANNDKIKAAFDRISSFFKSEDGEKFAAAISDAIGKVVDLFIWLADNADLVAAAFKAFIAVQAAKFLTDTALGAVSAGRAIATFGKEIKSLRVAYLAAEAGTAALTLKTRLLGLAFGPVGLAIAGLTALAYGYIKGMDAAAESTKDYADALYDLTFARSADDVSKGLTKARDEAERLQTQIADLYAVKGAESEGPMGLVRNFGAFTRAVKDGNAALTEGGYQKNIEKLTGRFDNLKRSIVEGEEKLTLFREREKLAANAEPLGVLASPTATVKEPKDTSKKEMSEANARANARRAIQKQLLDLDQQIFDARTDGEVRTSKQVQENYSLAVQKIESEIAEAYLQLDKLEQAARTANKGALPAEDAESLRLAREKLEVLRLTQNARAMESSEMQDIQIKEKAINDLIDERNAKIAYYNTLKETGAMSDGEAYGAVIAAQDQYNAQIRTLIQDLLPILQGIDPESNLYNKLGIPQMIAGLQKAQAEMVKLTATQRVALSIGKMFASGMSTSIVNFGQAIAQAIDGTQSWADAIKGAWDAFRNFAADFLQQIAQMIIQAIILQAIQNAISGGSGGYWGAVTQAFTQHTGGVVGSAGLARRDVNPAVFANAGRFHEGGLPGLKPNEVATILEKGEEVVTEDNPRHIANAGMGAAPQVNLEVVNAIDSPSVVAAGLANKGTRTQLYNFMKADKNQIKQMLGINS